MFDSSPFIQLHFLVPQVFTFTSLSLRMSSNLSRTFKIPKSCHDFTKSCHNFSGRQTSNFELKLNNIIKVRKIQEWEGCLNCVLFVCISLKKHITTESKEIRKETTKRIYYSSPHNLRLLSVSFHFQQIFHCNKI